LHLFRASTAGSGKSFLVDLASAIAVGRPAPVMSAGRDEKEFESRLVGLLLAGYPMVSVDNVNGELGGDLLCQAVERPLVRLRPLGRSDIIEIETRATVFATGNNARVAGDMTRRTVVADLDAGMERPELRQFSGDPVDTVMADRGRYVSACLIITRAYIAAGCPAMLPPIASFADWSGVVRSALVWLGCADPAETMNAARDDDPELMGIREMFAAWEAAFGIGTDTTVKAVCDEAEVHLIDDKHGHRLPERRNPELYDAVSKVAGERGTLNTLRLSKWLARNKGRIVGGKRIEKSTIAGHNNVTQWSLNHAGR